jgi:hypothetical protein
MQGAASEPQINEGSMWGIAMRDDLAPPGSRAASRMKGHFGTQEARPGPSEWSPTGARRKGRPERGVELRLGVGPIRRLVPGPSAPQSTAHRLGGLRHSAYPVSLADSMHHTALLRQRQLTWDTSRMRKAARADL